MSERATPFYCPYCGDEDLRMFGEVHGEWRCGACQRVFRLGYLGRSAAWTSPVADVPVADVPVAAMTESEVDR